MNHPPCIPLLPTLRVHLQTNRPPENIVVGLSIQEVSSHRSHIPPKCKQPLQNTKYISYSYHYTCFVAG